MEEKKIYEEPVVTKVEIDFSDRVVAAGCPLADPNCSISPSNWHNS